MFYRINKIKVFDNRENCIYRHSLDVEQIKTLCCNAGVRDMSGARLAKAKKVSI
ncbi:MAG: hypothetical protein LBS79_06350 [Tannerella sp.]|jgi:hypothetical protein|nr:hypothetical protein [Tannerella sp.]